MDIDVVKLTVVDRLGYIPPPPASSEVVQGKRRGPCGTPERCGRLCEVGGGGLLEPPNVA